MNKLEFALSGLKYAMLALLCAALFSSCGKAQSGSALRYQAQATNAYEKFFVPEKEIDAQALKMWGKRYPRRMPFLNVEAKNTLNPEDFGIVPDSGECMTDKFYALFREAAKSAPCRIVLKKGTYCFEKPLQNSNFAMSLTGLKDVFIDGSGSTILIKKPNMGVFSAHGTERVVVRGFVVDYNPLPYSTGVVLSRNEANKSADIEIMDGQLPFDKAWLKDSEWGFFLDKKLDGRLQENKSNVYFHSSVERVSDKVFRITMHPTRGGGSPIKVFNKGDIYTIVIRPPAAVCAMNSTKDLTFKDFEIRASAGSGFSGTYNDAPNFINCVLSMQKGRYRVSNSDTFHFQNSVTGPWIENCVSEGVADDAVNLYLRPNFIVSVVDDRTLRISSTPQSSNFEKSKFYEKDYAPGNKIAFFDGKKFEIFFVSEVESVDFKNGTITFKDKLPKVVCGKDKFACTTLYNLDFSSGFVIKNSVFRNSRRFGLYLKAPNGLVEGNYFYGLSASAIMARNEPGWPEGLYARNLIIANNVVDSCGFEWPYLRSPNSAAFTMSANGREGSKGFYAHKNIIIEGNVFVNPACAAMFIRNVDGLSALNNTVLRPDGGIINAKSQQPENGKVLFDIGNSIITPEN